MPKSLIVSSSTLELVSRSFLSLLWSSGGGSCRRSRDGNRYSVVTGSPGISTGLGSWGLVGIETLISGFTALFSAILAEGTANLGDTIGVITGFSSGNRRPSQALNFLKSSTAA